jgi:hypothetical protein
MPMRQPCLWLMMRELPIIARLSLSPRKCWIGETNTLRGMQAVATLLVLILVAATQLSAQTVGTATLIKAGRLLDPRTGNVLAPAAVLIEGTKIKQVGTPAQIEVPGGAKIVNLGNATLLPGLIDSHTHLLLDVIVPRGSGE